MVFIVFIANDIQHPALSVVNNIVVADLRIWQFLSVTPGEHTFGNSKTYLSPMLLRYFDAYLVQSKNVVVEINELFLHKGIKL